MANLIQKASNTSLAVSVTATFSQSPVAGHLLVAAVTANVGVGSISISGWSTGTSVAVGVAGGLVIFYKVSAGTETSVVANGTLATFMDLHIFEYDAINNASPLDKTATAADSGAGVTSRATGTTATLSQAIELAFAAVATAGNNGGGASWTNSFVAETTTTDLMTADLSVNATTALSSTASWTTSQRAAGAIVTFFGDTGDSYGLTDGIKPRVPAINWNHPLTKGLIFDSGFADRGNLTPRDIVSNNTSSTLTLGTGGFVTDLYGTVLSYDGTTTNCFWNTHSNQDNLTVYSYETLILIKGNGGGGLGRVFVKSNGNGPGYIMANIDGTNLFLNIQAATTNGQWGIPQPSSNVWHHIVYTINEASQPANIYLDGKLQTLTTNTASVGARTGESAHLYIGNTQSGLRGFNGFIAYVRQWNRMMNAQEVRALAQNPWQIYRFPKMV